MLNYSYKVGVVDCLNVSRSMVDRFGIHRSFQWGIVHAPTTVQYTDIALAAVLCSIAQVPVAKTTTTPHLIGGRTLHRSLEFFYSLTCKGRLWAITSPIRIMFTSSQWRSKKPTRVATTLVYIYINVLIHLTSLVPS